MSNQKLHIFFRRVSTTAQDIATQEAADLPYREKLDPDEILIVNEHAVSANKLSLDNRPEMKQVISLIEQGKVHTLYAFDRTRLFRETYEGMWFSQLRVKHGVRLILTSQGNGHLQSTEDFFLEGILALFSDIEGKSIARRSEETRRRYPPKKLGYKKEKETKKYYKDSSTQQDILEYFKTLNEIESIEELSKLIEEYRKKLQTSPDRLIDMARDPFYAGYDLYKGQDKLSHVEPYLEFEEFNHLQETIGNLLTTYSNQIKQLDTQNTFSPFCGKCHKPMKYWKNTLNQTAYYNCSNKHKKVMLPFHDFIGSIQLILMEIIDNLDTHSLLNHSLSRFQELRTSIESKLETIKQRKDKLMEELLILASDNYADWKNNEEYKTISQLKEDEELLLSQLEEKERYLVENKEIVDAIKTYLQDRCEIDPAFLCSMFIKQIIIHNDFIDFIVYKFDYLQNEQTELVYEGDVIA